MSFSKMNMIRATFIITGCLILIGCTPQKKQIQYPPNPMLPNTALDAREGVGHLFFPATEDGVVYVYDADTADVLFSAPVQKNQRFILDPQTRRATIEGKIVFEQPINKKHTHRIYFDPHGKIPKPTTQP